MHLTTQLREQVCSKKSNWPKYLIWEVETKKFGQTVLGPNMLIKQSENTGLS